jgi:hypothetical protein
MGLATVQTMGSKDARVDFTGRRNDVLAAAVDQRCAGVLWSMASPRRRNGCGTHRHAESGSWEARRPRHPRQQCRRCPGWPLGEHIRGRDQGKDRSRPCRADFAHAYGTSLISGRAAEVSSLMARPRSRSSVYPFMHRTPPRRRVLRTSVRRCAVSSRAKALASSGANRDGTS